jgi:two-component system sensor histidine kinase MtrB
MLVVGAPLSPPSGTSYEMYYVFPLDQVKSTLAHIRTRLLEGGLALIVLLVGVAVIVARHVVTPVRLAARTASRFAAGQLAERMDVRGGDDLAQLATAFNDMAGALQQQIARLEDLSRVQRRFTADVSHELRTPLTTVRMAADVLFDARDSYPPAVARSAELLQSELNRFEGLLADLLEISRYDANAAVLEVEQVDVVELVLGVVDGAAPLAAGRGVTIDVSDVPRTPVLAEVDPRRVSRILRNLVTNAVEYSEGRPVEVSLRADEATVGVRVRDHGPGLRPGDATRVFDRFWRADPSRARNTGGTGLGLSIALEDARLHGGWLGAWGRPGEGAAFRLVLPRVAGHPVVAAPVPLEDAFDPAGAR